MDKQSFFMDKITVRLFFLFLVLISRDIRAESSLKEGFINVPQSSGVRCFWWWLNGNVTKDAILRDMEEMKAKGFSGALIFDAGGAEQRGNRQVPAGPMYMSDEWRALFKYAVAEADRLGLELSLNIQSGWNLGGPMVTPEYASKMLTWSEVRVSGPMSYDKVLPEPEKRQNYYRDIAVLAYPRKAATDVGPAAKIRASSSQSNFPAALAFDQDLATFWVSGSDIPEQGPVAERPQWLEFEFSEPTSIHGVSVQGRKGYGPKFCSLEVLENDQFRTICDLKPADGIKAFAAIGPVTGKLFRLLITDAYDTNSTQPRNVQVEEFTLLDAAGNSISLTGQKPQTMPIRDLQHKAMFRLLGMAAPDSRHLLEDEVYEGEQPDVRVGEIIDLSGKMDAVGVLRWDVPAGQWVILRFGQTPTGATVSTSSGRWQGLAIDYMDTDAVRFYWDRVVAPLLEDVRPQLGKSLRYLHTDSWECGGANWTPGLRQEFLNHRGYDLLPYLPVIAGKIVMDRQTSNSFLADFRKTLADCMGDHYQLFADLSHRYGVGIHPESGGPHAGPFEALQTLGCSDIMMGEFWVPSPHRPRPVDRFYVKQASSAGHIYGKSLVAAEGFTSIGLHWDDVAWNGMKPSFDHELCSGLNLLFIHTFTCSPKEMGLPGQEYFAGTHFNPNITWWDESSAFIRYMNRCQFLLQKGQFEADVLYYSGDQVPNLIRLKEADPAGVLPGYDYDVTNEEALLRYATVQDGRITYSTGMQYRLLVLPDHKVLSHAVLGKIEELVRQGAIVLGAKPIRAVSLMGTPISDAEFSSITDVVWGMAADSEGSHPYGKGKVMWGKTARQVLTEMGIAPDFEADSPSAALDYIYRSIEGREVYFISNQQPQPVAAMCTFRVSGRQPELWDAVAGTTRPATAFSQADGRTSIPLELDPCGSVFVVFNEVIPANRQGTTTANYPKYEPLIEISGPWMVSFDPAWDGPKEVVFDVLTSWTEHLEPDVQWYSGKATYRKSFTVETLDTSGVVLDLGRVEDLGIAQVRLNGKDLGVVWAKPHRVDITGVLKKGSNDLEIAVVNSWRNRLIADAKLPQEQRLTCTNIQVTPQWTPRPSGLLGPVKVLRRK